MAAYGKCYESHLKRFVMGRSPLEGALWLVRELALPISAEQYLEQRQPHLEKLLSDCTCVPGAQALVASLRTRGLRLALATSSERTLYQLKVGKHGWFSAFEAVVCGDDPRLMRAKPAPDIFLLASAELGVASDRCLVFEDSAAGVQAGVAAGMRVIARLQAPVLQSDLALAERVVSNYAELDLDLILRRCDQ